MPEVVVAYNGRRVKIQIGPSGLLVDVLYEACERFGLGDVAPWTLLHNRKPLELSVTFRLSGLAGNATLDLAASGPPKDVVIGCSLADVGTFRATFKSDASLWSIYRHFVEAGKVPDALWYVGPLSSTNFCADYSHRI